MIIEEVELNMSHVGLGNLTESALMVIFGNAHSHHLTAGIPIKPNAIKDSEGCVLYPAYFMTHLRVPPHSLLRSYTLWDEVEIGVDIRRFGDTLLESTYLFGRKGEIPHTEIPHTVEEWDLLKSPSMRANNLFVVDMSEEEGASRRVSVPRSDCIIDLPKMDSSPQAIIKAKTVRTEGFDIEIISKKLCNDEPILYHVVRGRDAAPGHAMIFAKYCEIMDYAERRLLSRCIKPGFPVKVLDNLEILEREVYYYRNCFAGETLEVYLKGGMQECEPQYHGSSTHIISTAILCFQVEVYQKSDNSLLAIAKVKKLLAMPSHYQDLIQDFKRLMRYYL